MRQLNSDQISNLALTLMVLLEVLEKLTGQKIPADSKSTILEISIGIGLWFTGKPSAFSQRMAARVTSPAPAPPESHQFLEFTNRMHQAPIPTTPPQSRIPFPDRDPDDINTEF